MTVQTKALVYWWKEYYNELETAKQHSLWAKIKVEIDKLGNPKSLKEIKDKLRNLKDASKQARDNNKQTGKSPIFCPFYEDFEDIFGARELWIYLTQKKLVLLQVVIMLAMLHWVWSCLISILVEFWNWYWIDNASIGHALQNSHQVVLWNCCSGNITHI